MTATGFTAARSAVFFAATLADETSFFETFFWLMLLTDFLVFFDEGFFGEDFFFDEGFGVLRVGEPDRRAVDFEALLATFFRLLGRFLAAAFFAGIAPASNDGLNGTGDYT